jgi:hypothetical protein
MRDVLVRSDAFERWPEAIKLRFVGDFRDAYNTQRGTSYQITAASLRDEQDYDFTLANGKDALKVQHTFAAADPENEYVGPKLQAAIIAKLNSDLKHLKNIHTHISFKRIQNKNEASVLTEEIEKVVNGLVGSGKLTPSAELESIFHYRWTATSNPSVSPTISNFLTELRIYSSPYDNVTFGYGGQSVAMMSDDMRANQAIEKKEGHYSDPHDIVLVVHYNFPLFREFFEPVIKQKHSGSPFGGVWLFDAWKDKFIFIK